MTVSGSLLIDDREKWTHKGSSDTHISRYLDKHNIPYQVKRLDVGDYMYDGGSITVDRKRSLEEVSSNLTNRSDSSRFWREVRRAYQSGIKFVVLVESGPAVMSIQDVPKWKSKYTQVTGRSIQTEMIRLEHSYGVEWQFCSKLSTAKKIIEILEGQE